MKLVSNSSVCTCRLNNDRTSLVKSTFQQRNRNRQRSNTRHIEGLSTTTKMDPTIFVQAREIVRIEETSDCEQECKHEKQYGHYGWRWSHVNGYKKSPQSSGSSLYVPRARPSLTSSHCTGVSFGSLACFSYNKQPDVSLSRQPGCPGNKNWRRLGHSKAAKDLQSQLFTRWILTQRSLQKSLEFAQSMFIG